MRLEREKYVLKTARKRKLIETRKLMENRTQKTKTRSRNNQNPKLKSKPEFLETKTIFILLLVTAANSYLLVSVFSVTS